ncbi:MAG: PQQ-binding-like beta-propeller repeat protein [Opitutae bacterium]|nr:PQQ-binding-like beta-propeller repeat protein [Opitutae bacterium]
MKTIFPTLLATLLSLSSSFASNVLWPGWRGPDRDGRVTYFESPAQWPAKLKKEWSLEVGQGAAMPIVADSRVYQHARQQGHEVVWCLDLKTGDVLWRKTYPVPYTIPGPGRKHGNGPNSNPALADGRLFTLSVTGILSAWATDSGELLWRRDYSDRFAKSHPEWGHSTSPLIDGDRVVVHFGGAEAGFLAALDVATGEEVWTEGKDGVSHASPIIADIKGVRQIVEWNHEAVVGVESETGRRLWSYSLPHRGSNQNSPTPAYYQGRLLVGAEGRGIRSIQPQLDNGKWTVKENWHRRDISLNMASAVVSGNSLYGKSQFKRGQFFRLDIVSGKTIWLGPPRMGDYAAFLTFPGHILVLKDNAILEIFAAGEPDYRPIASYQVADSPTWAAPVLLSHGVLVKDRTKLLHWSL